MKEMIIQEDINKYFPEFIINEIDALISVVDINTNKVLYYNKKYLEEFGTIVSDKCSHMLHKGIDIIRNDINKDQNKQILKEGLCCQWEEINTLNEKTYFFNEKIVKDKFNRLVKLQFGIDNTSQKESEKELCKEREKTYQIFETLFNSTLEALIIQDEQHRCIRINKRTSELLGYSVSDIVGRNAFNFISGSSVEKVTRKIEENCEQPYEAIMIKKSKEPFPALLRGKTIEIDGKKIRVSSIVDMSEIKNTEKEIYKLAYYDSLCSLPNNALLKEKTQLIIHKHMEHKSYSAMLFINLDHFKTINDSKGHEIGDKILIECSKRLKSIIRDYDILARFGGDEFTLIIDTQKDTIENANDSAKVVAKKILETIKDPIYIDNNQFQLSASIGITIFNEHIAYGELLRRTVVAMHSAKEKGRDNFSFYDPILQKKLERKSILLEKLRDAINFNKIKIFYQKQVGVDEKVVGVEALARWEDEELGNISPVEFIPIAEESGLIIKYGMYLTAEVAKVLKEWEKDEVKKDWRISINVSLSQFERDDFEYCIKDIITDYRINPSLIRLEITESLLLKNANKAVKKIDYLKELGVTISIDDFGTGYSSLSYLKKLSIDELKIDKSFVDDIVTNESDEILVTAILSIGRKFGFDVIAEGVETKDMYEKLLSLGCKYFQGYLFSKPIEKEKL